MRLENKVALITGGANGVKGDLMGFGGACAWRFVEEGAKVVIADLDSSNGEKTAKQIKKEAGNAEFIRLDVTKDSDWKSAVDFTIKSYGKLDILVNCAGTASVERVEDTTEEIWDAQMDVHAKGALLGTQAVLPLMIAHGSGSLSKLSSINGLLGSQSSTAYHAAKGAVRLLTKNTAIQHAKDGVRANSVHPGYADTPMTKPLFSDEDALALRLNKVPLGRLGTADEIANGIIYLASDESSFVTGSELVIDGGMTAQ